jgi:hypothetical protein
MVTRFEWLTKLRAQLLLASVIGATQAKLLRAQPDFRLTFNPANDDARRIRRRCESDLSL